MRPASDLVKLWRSFAGRLKRLRQLYNAATVNLEPRRSELLAISVIELDNLILSTLRAFTISSLSAARTTSGNRIILDRQFHSEEEISAFILSIVSTAKFERLEFPRTVDRSEEPTVRDPRQTARVLDASGASNLLSIQNALALNTSLFMDLGTFRNFYAHRGQDTWRKVRSKAWAKGIITAQHANEVVTASMPDRPVSVYEDWLDEAEIFFEEATK